jgi:hypothetical protein
MKISQMNPPEAGNLSEYCGHFKSSHTTPNRRDLRHKDWRTSPIRFDPAERNFSNISTISGEFKFIIV